MNITSQGGMLYYKYPYGGINAPLIPDKSNGDTGNTFKYYMITQIGEKDPVIFEFDDNGVLWMNHEYMRWKKAVSK